MGGGGSGYGGGRRGGGGSNTAAAARARDQTNRSEAKVQEEQALREILARTQRPDDTKVREQARAAAKELNRESPDLRAIPTLGGSGAKGTYVEGISDHDIVVRVSPEDSGKGPREILHSLAAKLKRLHPNADVMIGRMAVTVKEGGRELQYVPAKRDGRYIRLPIPGQDTWGNQAQPRKFVNKLNRTDARLDGGVKEAIRAFRIAQEKYLKPEERLDGYHVESIALLAFRSYPTGRSRAQMAEDMTRAAASLVRKPIKDRTGQSLHVDEKLGEPNSAARQQASHALRSLADEMKKDRLEGGTFWRNLNQ